MGALGGLSEAELRSTFNGGLGMVCVVPAGAVEDGDLEPGGGRPGGLAGRRGRGDRRPRGALFGVLTVGVEHTEEEERRGASDRGWRLWNRQQPACPARAGVALRARRGDRPGLRRSRRAPALDWAVEQGIETLLVPAAPAGRRRRPRAGGPHPGRVGRGRRAGAGRPGRLHADHRAGGAGRLRGPDDQPPPGAAAGVPRRARASATRSRPASRSPA